MRRCTPVFDIETMIEACGTPWNHTQKQVVTRKTRKRLPPHRGIEALPPAPRSPSQQAASDATPTEGYEPSLGGGDDDDGNDEDPGEGTKRKVTSSASGGTASSEELVADEGGMPILSKLDMIAQQGHGRLSPLSLLLSGNRILPSRLLLTPQQNDHAGRRPSSTSLAQGLGEGASDFGGNPRRPCSVSQFWSGQSWGSGKVLPPSGLTGPALIWFFSRIPELPPTLPKAGLGRPATADRNQGKGQPTS